MSEPLATTKQIEERKKRMGGGGGDWEGVSTKVLGYRGELEDIGNHYTLRKLR